jgi:hypothetical protein
MIREIVSELAWQFDGTELGNRLWSIYERLKCKEKALWERKRKRK